MAYEEGLLKYIVFTPLTIVGAVSMYIYGGGLLALLNALPHIFSGDFVEAFMHYFIYSALPPTSIGQIISQILIGTVAAGIKWFVAMNLTR